MHHISEEDFKAINWLPMNQRVQQSLNVVFFKYVNNVCPDYMKEVFDYASKGRKVENIITLDFKFLFEKLTWGRKVFHLLVLQLRTNYQA